MSVSSEVATERSSGSEGTLFRHSRRPEWGVAVPTWENVDKCAYRFEDGRVRVLKRSFTHLMEPVAEDEAVSERVATELRKAVRSGSGKRRRQSARLHAEYPFSDQLKIFRKLYPKGFRGERWRDHFRGGENGGLKRHRRPAMDLAQERLTVEALDELVSSGLAGEIVDRAVEVLEMTSLVRRADVKALDTLQGEKREQVGLALRDFLHGDGEVDERFDRWVVALRGALGKRVGWRLATVLPALVRPEKHPCVHHSVLRKQAASIAPGRGYARRPGRVAYRNFRHVVSETRQRLESEGLKPRDLLDVHDFIWTTLRPAAAKELEGESS